MLQDFYFGPLVLVECSFCLLFPTQPVEPGCRINLPALADLTKQQVFKGEEEGREAKSGFGSRFLWSMACGP